jgi:transcriptional regulator with XRE-family HTH domain
MSVTPNQIVGEKIKMIRRQRRIEDLAPLAKISVATWYRYELGQVDISVSRLFQIADVLGVKPGRLLA